MRLSGTVLDKEHPDTLSSMDNLAFPAEIGFQGKHEQAEDMQRQALAGNHEQSSVVRMGCIRE